MNDRQKERAGRGAGGSYRLTVPLDASGIEDRDPKGQAKVAVRGGAGISQSRVVDFDRSGHGTAEFAFEAAPGALQVLVGPADASDAELDGLQTLQATVSPRHWAGSAELALRPIVIAPYFWWWWRYWCRTFVIRGRVLCPDGSPVPGAQVCAYDVDWWFFWSSTQLAGCATTDISGAFEIRFRWCCGWWPWWWWRQRVWRLEPHLVGRVNELVRVNPELNLTAASGDRPSLAPFGRLLEGGSRPDALERLVRSSVGTLDQLRERLITKLPAASELQALRVWPWWPWRPWWDCTPDIIFKVTQDCLGDSTVIVDEGVAETRWNIPNPLDVTLIANSQACCRPICHDPPCEGGACIIVDRVCHYPIAEISGNLGAPAGPSGYWNPGPVPPDSYNYHRPFAGIVPVYKNPGDLLGVDYLEFEYSADGGGTWNALPSGAAVPFKRQRWDVPGSPPAVNEPFFFDSISFPGHTVVETREHREGVVGGTWDVPGADHYWLSTNWDLLVPIDSRQFDDGTYQFRAVGWNDGGGGTLINRRVLPLCGSDDENNLVLTFDNQVVTPIGHPVAHLCGGVHQCTTEPDTHIVAVRINGIPVEACGTVETLTGVLEVDFMVQDTAALPGLARHLGFYTLYSLWGLNQNRNLLEQPGASVAVLGGGPSGWASGQTTGNYGTALAQGAVAPHWEGGTFRLTMPLNQAFPVPCCYQLELLGYKRPIAGYQSGLAFVCSDSLAFWNRTQYSLGVGICG